MNMNRFGLALGIAIALGAAGCTHNGGSAKVGDNAGTGQAASTAASSSSAENSSGADNKAASTAPNASNSVTGAVTPAASHAGADSSGKPYTVVDGNKVDPKTYAGWKAWRAADCARCHGAEQQGMVGPSLIDSLKVLSKDQVEQTILNGRPGTMMPPHKTMPTVANNIDGLYAYLKGRSDGAIKPGHLYPIQ